MSEFKGTAFPWRKVKGRETGEVFVLGPGEDEEVADVYGQANADLIAAAPDLLEALGCLLPVMKLADSRWAQTEEFRAADAAIRKALGDD